MNSKFTNNIYNLYTRNNRPTNRDELLSEISSLIKTNETLSPLHRTNSYKQRFHRHLQKMNQFDKKQEQFKKQASNLGQAHQFVTLYNNIQKKKKIMISTSMILRMVPSKKSFIIITTEIMFSLIFHKNPTSFKTLLFFSIMMMSNPSIKILALSTTKFIMTKA